MIVAFEFLRSMPDPPIRRQTAAQSLRPGYRSREGFPENAANARGSVHLLATIARKGRSDP